MKPVALVRRAIGNSSAEGDLVFDPFLGSGTTMVACDHTNRACRGIDIDPAYVDVAVRRWQQLSGEHARLDGDDRTFEELRRTKRDKRRRGEPRRISEALPAFAQPQGAAKDCEPEEPLHAASVALSAP